MFDSGTWKNLFLHLENIKDVYYQHHYSEYSSVFRNTSQNKYTRETCMCIKCIC